MTPISKRIDVNSWKHTVFYSTKNKKGYAKGIGFCGGSPMASAQGAGYSSQPLLFRNNQTEKFGYRDLKKIEAHCAVSGQVAGCWHTTKGDARALLWNLQEDGSLVGIDLHRNGWDRTNAMACDGRQQVGYGYELSIKSPCRALLWSGNPESFVVLGGPEENAETHGHGVGDGVQVGTYGGGRSTHACMWRGSTESMIDLHPIEGAMVSEAMGAGDGEQVGAIYKSMEALPALWRGTAASFVNLLPKGFKRGRASNCARGFQVGWVSRQKEGMEMQAALWGGSPDTFIDLHQFVVGPWNCSWATHLEVDGDTIRIIGTVQQIERGNYECNAGEQPAVWEAKLLIPEAPLQRSRPISPAAAADMPASPEERIQTCTRQLAELVIAGNYAGVHALLAPWLQKQVTVKKLKSIFQGNFIDGVQPHDFDVGGNSITLAELRDLSDEEVCSLADFKKIGDSPSLEIVKEITPQNYRAWTSIDFTPEPDSDSDLDFCLRVRMIIVETDGGMHVGYLEPTYD